MLREAAIKKYRKIAKGYLKDVEACSWYKKANEPIEKNKVLWTTTQNAIDNIMGDLNNSILVFNLDDDLDGSRYWYQDSDTPSTEDEDYKQNVFLFSDYPFSLAKVENDFIISTDRILESVSLSLEELRRRAEDWSFAFEHLKSKFDTQDKLAILAEAICIREGTNLWPSQDSLLHNSENISQEVQGIIEETYTQEEFDLAKEYFKEGLDVTSNMFQGNYHPWIFKSTFRRFVGVELKAGDISDVSTLKYIPENKLLYYKTNKNEPGIEVSDSELVCLYYRFTCSRVIYTKPVVYNCRTGLSYSVKMEDYLNYLDKEDNLYSFIQNSKSLEHGQGV